MSLGVKTVKSSSIWQVQGLKMAEKLDKYVIGKMRKHAKRQMHRLWRRLNKQLLEDAPVKPPYKGWVS